jgi:hypothetical protein
MVKTVIVNFLHFDRHIQANRAGSVTPINMIHAMTTFINLLCD